MCLLVVSWHEDREWPLVIGANRDEWLDRPATPLAVLRERNPRVLGGRDQRAGGTWLAVNEHGVVCGLTNGPTAEGPDATRESRGRLPLAACRARTAEKAAALVADEVADRPYNPAWLLVADRSSLHYLAVEPDAPTRPRRLGPGLHVLENAGLESESAKADQVRGDLGPGVVGTRLWDALPRVLASHALAGPPGQVPRFPDGRERLAATLAPCVHSDGYGTRWSAMVRVARSAEVLPELLVADGPPCQSPFVDQSGRWRPLVAVR